MIKSIKEKIDPVLIDVDTEIEITEKPNLEFLRKLILYMESFSGWGANVWGIMLTTNNGHTCEARPWDIDEYIDDLSSFKKGLQLWCCEKINPRLINYTWTVEFYDNEDGYDYSIKYFNTNGSKILYIKGSIFKDQYEDIKRMLSFKNLNEFYEKEYGPVL